MVDGREAFFADTKTQDAVLRNLQTLAESLGNVSERLKTNYPDVDWRAITAFRNVVVHGKGTGIHWEDIDEDIRVEGLLAGRPSGESQLSFKRWLATYSSRRPKRSNGQAKSARR